MSPFSGTPRGDLILDVLAAIVLLLSLAIMWGPDGVGNPRIAATKVDVLLVTLISLLSLTLPYLARVGVLPATWTVITRRNVRVLANVPYAILVLVYYVISLTSPIDYSYFLGAAVPIGLAGAALAAQPRLAELGPLHLDSGVSELWMRIFAAFAGLVILTSVVGFVLGLVDSASYFSVLYLLRLLALAALAVAPITVGALGLWRRSGECALALGVLGAALGVAMMLEDNGYYVAGSVTIGLVFIPAVGAIAASPVVRRVMSETAGHELWLGAAVRVLELVMLIAGIYAILQVISLLDWMDGVTATRLIVNVFIVVGAVVARSALRGNPVAARSIVLGVAGGILLGGLVVWVVVSRSEYVSLLTVETAVYFLLPAAVVALLTAPASVRAFFPAHVPSTPAPSWATVPAGGAGRPTRVPAPGGHWGQQQAPVWPPQPAAMPAAAATREAPAAWPTPVGDPGGVAVPWRAPTPATAGTVTVASPSKRLAAFLLDGAAASLLVLLAYMFSIAGLSGAVSNGSDSAAVAGLLGLMFIPVLVSVAFAIAQLVWEGKQGLTVGNKLMGIHTVTFGADEPPGIGRAFIRRLIEGLGSLVIVGGPVIAASAAWDEPTRRQGWQDKIASTEMILRQGATGMAGNTTTATESAIPPSWITTAGRGDSPSRVRTPPPPAVTWSQQPTPVTQVPAPPVPEPKVPAPPAPPPPPPAVTWSQQPTPITPVPAPPVPALTWPQQPTPENPVPAPPVPAPPPPPTS